ncbi:TPA: S1 RNA-binding domain-containing protein, partial [Candidatus Poribacteria bacterium]|nr:S1 RNA-binding domain-containing protein [Candidatus Poribacteria bacterium]
MPSELSPRIIDYIKEDLLRWFLKPIPEISPEDVWSFRNRLHTLLHFAVRSKLPEEIRSQIDAMLQTAASLWHLIFDNREVLDSVKDYHNVRMLDANAGIISEVEEIISGEETPRDVLIDIGYKSEGVIPGVEFDDLSQLKPGDTFDVLLVAIEDDNGMVVLSKEKADLQLRWQRVVDICKEGSIIEGLVKSRVRGGLIVEVAGVEAFLPGSQIDVSPVHNMDEFIDKTYEFRVIKISAERRNIILSRRDLIEERLKNKKKELMATIEKGQKRMGIVKNITDFGV